MERIFCNFCTPEMGANRFERETKSSNEFTTLDMHIRRTILIKELHGIEYCSFCNRPYLLLKKGGTNYHLGGESCVLATFYGIINEIYSQYRLR